MDFVLDASVALKWLLTEEYSEPADALLKRVHSRLDRCYAPELLLVEVAHVLRKQRGQRRISNDDVWDLWANFLTVPVEYLPIGPLMIQSFALAVERGITAYDALYVELATNLDVPVVTSDGGIWSNFGPGGRAVHIKSIPV